MRIYKTGQEFDRLAQQILRDCQQTATDTDIDAVLDEVPKEALETALELAETRARRQVVRLQLDGLFNWMGS